MIIQQYACKTKLSVSFAFKESHSWYVHKIVARGKQYTETTIVLPSPLSCLHIYSCLIYADRKKQNMQIRAGTSIKQCIDILLPHPDTHNTRQHNCLFLLPLSSTCLPPHHLRTRGQSADGRRITVDHYSWAQQSRQGQRSPAASPWKMPAGSLYSCRCLVVYNSPSHMEGRGM